MKFSLSQFKRVGLACVALGAIAVSQQAFAEGTAAELTIENRATVNYQVGGVAQTLIESSPAGNSTAGLNAGADTEFLVDRKIDFTVEEVGAAETEVSAGAANVVTTFRIINTGNGSQGFDLTPAHTGGTLFGHADFFDMDNLEARVSTAACVVATPAAPVYNSVSDTAQDVLTLGDDDCVYVFIVADTPVSAQNARASNVRLTAVAVEATTLNAINETNVADQAMVVEVVFADAGENNSEFAEDQFYVQTAALSVAKTSLVVSDPINGALSPTVFPRAIPEAIVEYGITLTNTGAADAEVVTITDSIPANTTFENNTYSGGSNVRITVGATDTFCTAEAGADGNTDGCYLTAGGVLTVGAPAVTAVQTGAGNALQVRFRVSIN
jgi:uncharacterized repeat protein (TIGR01451 family)